MGKLVSSILITLDGFVSGPKGEIDIFKVGEDFFEHAKGLTEQAGTALYGRNTWHIMDSYWPGAADKPGASQHDKEHSAWYNRVDKIVLSTTLKSVESPNVKIIGTNVFDEVKKLKQEKERAIQIFGSPGVVRSLMQENLIDEYWIFMASVVLGNGVPLFAGIGNRVNLKLLSAAKLTSDLVALHYEPVA